MQYCQTSHLVKQQKEFREKELATDGSETSVLTSYFNYIMLYQFLPTIMKEILLNSLE